MDDASKFEVLPNPIKSRSDKKEYKVIKLKNGLRAILISDVVAESNGENPNEKKAAASLSVGVGSFSDPKEVPGMSHFLEHMVSMGSEKYPGENDFESSIQSYGGDTNAATDFETTSFYFYCLEKHLKEALDKFAQFFIAPLMNKESISRERQAVDSEFQMNALPSDSHRQDMILLSLANKQNSPMNFFSWGNLKTLKDDITDDKLYEKLHEYRRRHYSAHRMSVAIRGRLSLETLQNLVVESFSNVHNNNLPPLDFSEYAKTIFDTPEFNKIYYVKPVQEVVTLKLTWSLPSLKNKYRNKPSLYISNLIGDEGKGSLLSYMKKLLWATSLQCDAVDYDWYSIFATQISLTDEGLRNLYRVIEAIFSYIKMLKDAGPQKEIFEEFKTVTDNEFRFVSEESAEETVNSLSESMQNYPPQDYIGGSALLYEYDPEIIKMVLSLLVPSKVNIMVTTKNLPEGLKFNQVEKWIGTEYVSVDIPSNLKTTWETIVPYPEFKISKPNPYVSNNFDILPETPNHPDYPEKIINNSKCELWYRKDQKFKLPNAYYFVYLLCPTSDYSAKTAALSDLFVNLLKFAIGEEAYAAKTAGLEYSFQTNDFQGLLFKANGFHEKIPTLIELGARYIKNLKNEVNAEIFKKVKAQLLKTYYNLALSPNTLAMHARMKVLTDAWTVIDKYNDLLKINYDDLKSYLDNYTKNLYVKALIQGNVSEDIAKTTINKFIEDLDFEPLSKDKFPKRAVAELPIGEKCLNLDSFNKSDINSVIVNYYQIGPYSLKNSSLLTLITKIIEEPLFDVLRTKEQLGYDVSITPVNTYDTLGCSIGISSQATKFTTQHLNSRIEEFLKRTEKLLRDMNKIVFEKYKRDIIEAKEEEDVQLKEEVNRNWSEIYQGHYQFDRLKRQVEMVRSVTLDETKCWWNKLNRFGGGENFRKISIQVAGHIPPDDDNDDQAKNINQNQRLTWIISNKVDDNKNKSDCRIENIDSFKSTLSQYPSTL